MAAPPPPPPQEVYNTEAKVLRRSIFFCFGLGVEGLGFVILLEGVAAE